MENRDGAGVIKDEAVCAVLLTVDGGAWPASSAGCANGVAVILRGIVMDGVGSGCCEALELRSVFGGAGSACRSAL